MESGGRRSVGWYAEDDDVGVLVVSECAAVDAV